MRDEVGTNDWQAWEREWRDPANWRWMGIYVAPKDPRLVVRKKTPHFGWTFNFAHRGAWWLLAGVLLVPLTIIVVANVWRFGL